MIIVDVLDTENQFSVYKDIHSEKIYGNQWKTNPQFSIVIPTCGRPLTFKEALKSAVKQVGFLDYEIIVVDNNPDNYTDETLNIIRTLDNGKIEYYLNQKNIGLCGNWNRCTELSNGNYIVMLHDDDVLSPYFLKTMNQFLLRYKVYGVVGVKNVIFSDTLPIFHEKSSFWYHKISTMDFFYGNYIGISGMTYNKNLAIKLGGFKDEDYPNEDSIFIAKATLLANVYKIDLKLSGYRVGINASLNEPTMRSIILHTQATRESLATHSQKINSFMRFYSVEYFKKYVDGAAKFWKMPLNYKELVSLTGLSSKKVSNIKLFMLSIQLFFANGCYYLNRKHFNR